MNRRIRRGWRTYVVLEDQVREQRVEAAGDLAQAALLHVQLHLERGGQVLQRVAQACVNRFPGGQRRCRWWVNKLNACLVRRKLFF